MTDGDGPLDRSAALQLFKIIFVELKLPPNVADFRALAVAWYAYLIEMEVKLKKNKWVRKGKLITLKQNQK